MILVVVPVLCWGATVVLFGGVRTVIPGEVFRSPQLGTRALRQAIDEYGIRSVLNLRGRGHGRTWYHDERTVCEQAGVAHVTLTFDIDEWPPRPVVLRFLEILKDLEPPVLFHCNRGVDRAGWAGAVVVLADGGSLEDGERQLSPVFGHICIRSKCPQHFFFAAYRRWLVESAQVHSKMVFQQWMGQIYCPDPWNAQLALAADAPSKAVGGDDLVLSVEVINRGRDAWQIGSSDIRLGIRMIGPLDSIPDNPIDLFLDRKAPVVDLGRGGLGDDHIDPGGAGVFEVTVRLPIEPGLYLVQADMVKEHVHWFSEMGWPGLVWPLEIVERD
ncbi:MAG: hypothetical protein DRJ61_12785 [Acidobacteria bacterium]|nr:MAG: hypothetical protein DRJ61_12785 [Acidobacteriota bacterium]